MFLQTFLLPHPHQMCAVIVVGRGLSNLLLDLGLDLLRKPQHPTGKPILLHLLWSEERGSGDDSPLTRRPWKSRQSHPLYAVSQIIGAALCRHKESALELRRRGRIVSFKESL